MSDSNEKKETPTTIIFQCLMAQRANWLCAAASDDQSRYFMCGVHIEKDEEKPGAMLAVCTDARRLHVLSIEKDYVEAFKVQPGEYKIAKTSKKEVILTPNPDSGQFPMWKKVIPQEVKEVCVYTSFPTSDKYIGNFTSGVYRLYMNNLNPINHGYLADLNLLDSQTEWTVEANENRYQGVMFKPVNQAAHNGTFAVIMPMEKPE